MSRKYYRYNPKSVKINPKEDVVVSIKNISNGNDSYTFIDTPTVDPSFTGSRSANLGLGKDLIGATIVIVSQVDNPLPMGEEDEISLQILINDEVIVDHVRPKSEADRISISIKVKFEL